MDNKTILITSDGFGINHKIYNTVDEAKEAMKSEYDAMFGNLTEDEYIEMSYINDTDAILYNDGEDVYLWQIITV